MNEIQYEWHQPIEKAKKHHLQAYHEQNPQCKCIKKFVFFFKKKTEWNGWRKKNHRGFHILKYPRIIFFKAFQENQNDITR